MTGAQKAYDFIISSLKDGLTVYIGNSYHTTRITPKTFDKWNKAGLTLFRMTPNGHLEIASGKRFNSIAINNVMLSSIKAFKE
jgi:hypothetical protein